MEYGFMPGRYPAIVKTYNQARRTCRVEIPGLTDGGDVLPEAEIEYSIGDKSRSGKWETEIEILPDDTVWISFIGGDPRYPIITGWRNPQAGNSVDWRRWHHKNIEMIGDELICSLAGTDKRVQAGRDLQLQCGADALIRSGADFKVNAGAKAQMVCQDRVLIRSVGSQIILRSATGTLVI